MILQNVMYLFLALKSGLALSGVHVDRGGAYTNNLWLCGVCNHIVCCAAEVNIELLLQNLLFRANLWKIYLLFGVNTQAVYLRFRAKRGIIYMCLRLYL